MEHTRQPLYYLKNDLGKFLNFIILLGKPCPLEPCSNDRTAIIYTEDQLDVAQEYYGKRKIYCYPQRVLKIYKNVKFNDKQPMD